MGEWWEQPYAGGPPVEVKGFPRALYPPDAKEYGKTPSSRGPDVIAYKRIVSRLGRWPWQTFDDGYWTDFAHGTPGHDVQNSGVAGVQWQQHIDATGWLGEKTFTTFRYARVPNDPAFPHAGEPAMDAKAVALINEAYDLFHGSEPPPVEKTTRQQALERAVTQSGYKETPAGSNLNKFGSWYGMDGQPWCAMFVTWCYEGVPGGSDSFVKGSRYAYVPYIVADARAKKNGLKTTDDPIPGDLVCYDWTGDAEYDHVGLFERFTGGGVKEFSAVEGNTSTSNNSNGGEVMRRNRSRGAQGTVFVRVAE